MRPNNYPRTNQSKPSRPEDFGSDGYPSDWHTDTSLHGFSKAHQHRHYAVRLSVLGKQHSIATTTSQQHAARLYDLAVWKLAHFLTRRLNPNNPEAFEEITQAMVDKECPSLNWLYDACVTSTGPVGDSTERELREVAIEASQAPPGVPTGGNSETFGRYRKQVDRTRAQSLVQVTRLTALRHMLTLNKLPEVARVATEYEMSLNHSESKARELQGLLASHEGFYKSMYENL